MLNKSKSVISVLLSEDSFQAIHLQKMGTTFRVVNLVNHSVKGFAEAEMIKTIQASLSGFPLRGSDVACVLPSNLVTTKNIEIPAVNEEEIRSIVNLQAGRHTPFSREEIQIGYVNVGVVKANYTRVLLVIANKSILKNQLSVFDKAGLKVKHVLFASEGIAQMYRAAADSKSAGGAVGLIDLGENATEFSVIQNGKIVTTRNIPIGRSQIESGGNNSRDYILDELHKTLESYQAEDIGQLPKKYLMTSDDEAAKAVQDAVTNRLGWDIECAPYVDLIKAAPAVLKKIATKYPGVSFLSVAAPAYNTSTSPIDLFPEELQLQKSLEAQGKEFIKTGILIVVILPLVACFLVVRQSFMDLAKTTLKKNYESKHEQAKVLKDQTLRAKVVENFADNRMGSLDAINELYRFIPDTVYLSSITMDQDGKLDIQGVADTSSIVFNLGSALKESSMFESVEIKSTASKKDRGKDASSFEITLKLKTAASPTKKTKDSEG
ncbi:MAG: pilus assembly protein PilM [Candidatus Omnitrophica bacterium]|nr:pilus assembly protein PilM [Candidatus Omnitrophota bacterium]